jgi:hypothetical protein
MPFMLLNLTHYSIEIVVGCLLVFASNEIGLH